MLILILIWVFGSGAVFWIGFVLGARSTQRKHNEVWAAYAERARRIVIEDECKCGPLDTPPCHYCEACAVMTINGGDGFQSHRKEKQ